MSEKNKSKIERIGTSVAVALLGISALSACSSEKQNTSAATERVAPDSEVLGEHLTATNKDDASMAMSEMGVNPETISSAEYGMRMAVGSELAAMGFGLNKDVPIGAIIAADPGSMDMIGEAACNVAETNDLIEDQKIKDSLEAARFSGEGADFSPEQVSRCVESIELALEDGKAIVHRSK